MKILTLCSGHAQQVQTSHAILTYLPSKPKVDSQPTLILHALNNSCWPYSVTSLYFPAQPFFAITGVIASCSIFIENKSRRAELALYVLPRAVESLYETLLRRRVLPRLPLWEVALFSLCMGRLMYYRQVYHPTCNLLEQDLS